jgi:anthranilate synthase component 1
MKKEKLADTETPVSAYLKLCLHRRDSFLLESVEKGETLGRYSIVGWDPLLSLELQPDRAVVSRMGVEEIHPREAFFHLIRRILGETRLDDPPGVPCVGSLVGYVGYDAVRLVERLPPSKADEDGLPVARLILPSRFLVFDHIRRLMTLLILVPQEDDSSANLDSMEHTLETPLSTSRYKKGLRIQPPPRERFVRAVLKAKKYIQEGEIFQVVLSDCFDGTTDLEPFDVYRRLRVRSPSPYMFFLDFGGFQLVGASPETLVKVKEGIVYIRPIAGTRGRSNKPIRDGELERELLESEKERAEHIMLVDLARNDAGRVCQWGSVRVSPYMIVERYSHVMHLVSEVSGLLKPRADVVDVFTAAFPAGTVTGAPKVRAMEIIDELEGSNRGPYAGAVGYLGPGQQMDTCIAIRMILFQRGRFRVRVGAGIVADSDPDMEYGEIHHKAAQSIEALKSAVEAEP